MNTPTDPTVCTAADGALDASDDWIAPEVIGRAAAGRARPDQAAKILRSAFGRASLRRVWLAHPPADRVLGAALDPHSPTALLVEGVMADSGEPVAVAIRNRLDELRNHGNPDATFRPVSPVSSAPSHAIDLRNARNKPMSLQESSTRGRAVHAGQVDTVPGEKPIRVRLLTRQLQVLDDDGRPVHLGKSQRLLELLTLLAVRAPALTYQSDLATVGTTDMINQLTKAIRERAGLGTFGGPVSGCRLLLSPDQIDLHRVIAASRIPNDQVTLTGINAALDLVDLDGPCAELTDRHPTVTGILNSAVSTLRRRSLSFRRKRVLVVEDQIGDDLRGLLGQHDCTLVTSYGEVKALKNLVDFDLALVDLRLSDRPDETAGEDVLRLLCAQGADYPIVIMTSTPWADEDITAYSRSHGVTVVTKGDAGTGRLTTLLGVAERLLLSDGLRHDQRVQLEQQLVELRAHTAQTLTMRGQPPARIGDMNADWGRLWTFFEEEFFVGRVREAIAGFRAKWAM